ncbi:MAG TPA: SGNH/GDSL hydrolase family protein [Gemmatimonadales bacterium]|nr:SGNH/GDSL hydrolase family protein [Gemmatimonadales bacterium]
MHRPLLLALCLAEVAACALGLTWHRYQFILGSLNRKHVAYVVIPAVVLVVSLISIARWVGHTWAADRRTLILTAALNAGPLGIAFCGGELTTRLLTVPTALGPMIRGVVLLPKSWQAMRARNLALLERAPAKISYFVADTLLGWSVGASRRSTDGMYASSAEAIRSPVPGIAYSRQRARHTIAVIGDSYTFGLEVPFADSWAARLEHELGQDFRVLNFGVDGYGVDQAYLRYARDVRPWHPTLVIFGFIEHDLYRSMSIHNFITFPEWGFPFSKPRFAYIGDSLALLNVPIPSPGAIAREPTVADLPYLEFEPAFHRSEWTWQWYDRSRLIRFVLSRFPPYYADNPLADLPTELRVNLALLTRFAHEAPRDGTVPLIVYLPSRGDYIGWDRSEKDSVLRQLERGGILFENLTSCLGTAGGAQLFIPGHPHYAPSGNAAVAGCLLPVVRSILTGPAK